MLYCSAVGRFNCQLPCMFVRNQYRYCTAGIQGSADSTFVWCINEQSLHCSLLGLFWHILSLTKIQPVKMPISNEMHCNYTPRNNVITFLNSFRSRSYYIILNSYPFSFLSYLIVKWFFLFLPSCLSCSIPTVTQPVREYFSRNAPSRLRASHYIMLISRTYLASFFLRWPSQVSNDVWTECTVDGFSSKYFVTGNIFSWWVSLPLLVKTVNLFQRLLMSL